MSPYEKRCFVESLSQPAPIRNDRSCLGVVTPWVYKAWRSGANGDVEAGGLDDRRANAATDLRSRGVVESSSREGINCDWDDWDLRVQ